MECGNPLLCCGIRILSVGYDPSSRNGRPDVKEVYKMNGSNRATPKILVADDDPCVLRAIAARCSAMGFDVETAASGLQALIKAGECQPDVLIIDIHMPEVSG